MVSWVERAQFEVESGVGFCGERGRGVLGGFGELVGNGVWGLKGL